MKKLSLRPYHGTIWLCATLDELRKAYKRLAKVPYPYEDDPDGGRFICMDSDRAADRVFLVYGKDVVAVSHEFCHVLLVMFRTIGHDPREGDGEPFCYMLSQLMLDAGY